ncbi:MAG TPA: hypothetical protein ACFCUC_03130 [Desulfobacterales bacterium]
MIDDIFRISEYVRYVAIYKDGKLETRTKENTKGASSSESDKYEELIVNPVMLKAASQRGNIDCGGLEYLLIRYGNFFQFVLPVSWGHVSVCIEKDADPIAIGYKVKALFKNESTKASQGKCTQTVKNCAAPTSICIL